MATWGSGLIPMTYEYDTDSRTPVQNTWYTITDYTGLGRLDTVGILCQQSAELRITLDGTAKIFTGVDFDMVRTLTYGYNGNSFVTPMSQEFISSLKVEYRNIDGTDNLKAYVGYGICSHEISRTIYPADSEIPGRNYTYPFPVMLIEFEGNMGKSSKIQFLPAEKLKLSYNTDGTVFGELQEPEFIADIDAAERIRWKKKEQTKKMIIDINSKKYMINIIGGILDNVNLPKKEKEMVIDAT